VLSETRPGAAAVSYVLFIPDRPETKERKILFGTPDAFVALRTLALHLRPSSRTLMEALDRVRGYREFERTSCGRAGPEGTRAHRFAVNGQVPTYTGSRRAGHLRRRLGVRRRTPRGDRRLQLTMRWVHNTLAGPICRGVGGPGQPLPAALTPAQEESGGVRADRARCRRAEPY